MTSLPLVLFTSKLKNVTYTDLNFWLYANSQGVPVCCSVTRGRYSRAKKKSIYMSILIRIARPELDTKEMSKILFYFPQNLTCFCDSNLCFTEHAMIRSKLRCQFLTIQNKGPKYDVSTTARLPFM